MAESDEVPTPTSLDRGLDILFCLRDADEPLGVTDIAERTGGAKSAVHRQLQVLVRRGLVVQDEDTRSYLLGLGTFELAVPVIRRADLGATVLPALQEIVELTGETAILWLLDGDHYIAFAGIESPQPLRVGFEAGVSRALPTDAVGRAILAHLPADDTDRLLGQPIEKLTPSTMTDRRQIEADLVAIRERGYAISVEEAVVGGFAMAVPLLGHRVLGAIGILGPVARYDADVLRAWASGVEPLAKRCSVQVETIAAARRPA